MLASWYCTPWKAAANTLTTNTLMTKETSRAMAGDGAWLERGCLERVWLEGGWLDAGIVVLYAVEGGSEYADHEHVDNKGDEQGDNWRGSVVRKGRG